MLNERKFAVYIFLQLKEKVSDYNSAFFLRLTGKGSPFLVSAECSKMFKRRLSSGQNAGANAYAGYLEGIFTIYKLFSCDPPMQLLPKDQKQENFAIPP